jgi:hypothetical protein
MTDPKPYRATPDELRAIDAGLLDMGGPPIPNDKPADFYRAEAARLRGKADTAETIRMRITILGNAERLDKLAETFSANPKA